MPGYEFDVFISYRRDGKPYKWVRNHFFPLLTESLDDHLPWDPAVFVDDEMEVGVDWPRRLQEALSRTKILIPVFSAQYFRSPWCMAEWRSMVEREKLLGPGTCRLIYPILFADSETFPKFARRRSWKDLKAWAFGAPAFSQSKDYLDLEKEVREIASELVTLLRHAPKWQPGWPIRQAKPLMRAPAKLPRFGT